MANIVNVVFFLAIVTTAQSLAVVKEMDPPHYITKDHVLEMSTYDSKPGTPVIDDWTKAPLFGGGEEWRGMLGERLVIALNGGDVMTFCKRLLSINDYSWCRHAMPIESKDQKEELTKIQREYVLPEIRGPEKNAETKPESQLGLSFGISKPDKWSDIMSDKYGVETKLFDSNFSSEALSVALQGREKYSTLVKLDVDGAEWAILDWLTKNMPEMDKIRTIDVRMHMTKEVSPDGPVDASTQEAMTRHVEIVETLKKYFTVVGSSVEGDVTSFKSNLLQQKDQKIKEPLIHTEGGLPLEEFYVSYLNRILL